MEFNEKLQQLRKQRGLTQEELAEELYVSRTAISKWESGRGYPSIDSLKAIAVFFSVTVDELLSGDEILCIAEKDSKQKECRFRDTVFGLLDASCAMLLFLPFFRQNSAGSVQGVSLLALADSSEWLRIIYFILLGAVIVCGLLTLTLQNLNAPLWADNKDKISLGLNTCAALLFIVSLQPYAAAFMFIFLAIKALMLIKWR